MAAVKACLFVASLFTLGLAQDTSAQTFANVLKYLQCDRAQRNLYELTWSQDLAVVASESPDDKTLWLNNRWKVAWSGADMLASFQSHVLGSEKTYEGAVRGSGGGGGGGLGGGDTGEGSATSPRKEDYMAIAWKNAKTIGCSTTSSGYVCVLEASFRSGFFERPEFLVRRRWLSEAAACSEDSLCPIHGEEPEPCKAAGCSHEPGWTWCERPNKQQDKDSVKATFANMMATLNCERKKRGAYPAYWKDRNVDWAFKLRAAPTDSAYEHAFFPGLRGWDIAWSGGDASQSFGTFLIAARSAYESGEANSLSYDYKVLMSRISIHVGCYKAGDSNACVISMFQAVDDDAQLPASTNACRHGDSSRSDEAEVEAPFAGVMDYLNCARARRFHDKLEWSDDLAQLASTGPEPGFVGDDESRWSVSVPWSGDNMLEGFKDHFGNSESAYEGQNTSTPQEDFMVMVWKSAKKVGCEMTMQGEKPYVCVFEGLKQVPFLSKNDTNVRELLLTEKAACSQDRLCPVHGELDEMSCMAASCSWEPGWTWCERPNKAADSMKTTFEGILAPINCERKARGASPLTWDERNADWAFKLRAADKASDYEGAFLRGYFRDFAWSSDDVVSGFDAFMREIQAGATGPQGDNFKALMSKSAFQIGCFKSGKSNACVLRFNAAFNPEDAPEVAQRGTGDCSKEALEKLRMAQTNTGSDIDTDVDMMMDSGSCRICGIGSVLVFILIGVVEMQQG